MIDDTLPPRILVDDAVMHAIEEFDDEVSVTIHALGCPAAETDDTCQCEARPLTVPDQKVAAVWWWMRRLTWRMTKRAR